MLLLAVALCMKALVPSGFMVDSTSKTLTVMLCTDGSGTMVSKDIVVPIDGKSHRGSGHESKSETPCAFSALSMASLGGADTILLALALLFIVGLGFASHRPSLVEVRYHLRPPLRGPPAAT